MSAKGKLCPLDSISARINPSGSPAQAFRSSSHGVAWPAVARSRVAVAPWALDSGGFSELSIHGRWTVPAAAYVAEVRRFASEIGRLDWAAPQDWMCEPDMLRRTGLGVADHQARTVQNFLELRERAPELPWIPVLQGWTRGDYLDCVELYQRAGVDLVSLPLVGIGTVCRRQDTLSAELTVRWLADDGLKLHGFGFKSTGLRACADVLASADSMAWSVHARRRPPLEGCTGHKSCSNCMRYALRWRAGVVDALPEEAA